MGIKTQKVLRLISKIILILVGVGLVGWAGYYAYKSITFKPQNVVVTNITDGSATVTWTTTSPMKGIVYVKKDKGLLPGPLGIVGSTMAYDDRDVSDAQKACVDAFNKRASETKDSTFSVSGSNFDCENIKVTKMGSYYTHSVTITNLDENSTYNFVVGDGIWSFKENVSTVKTFSILDSVGEPMPVFGRITGDDGTYSRDAIVYITFNDGSESKDSIVYSSAVNDDGGWYVDASAIRDVDGNVLPLEVTNDTFKVKGIYSDYGVSEEQQFIYGFFEVATFDILVKKTQPVSSSIWDRLIMGAYAGCGTNASSQTVAGVAPGGYICSTDTGWKAATAADLAKEASTIGIGNVLKVAAKEGNGIVSSTVLNTLNLSDQEKKYVTSKQSTVAYCDGTSYCSNGSCTANSVSCGYKASGGSTTPSSTNNTTSGVGQNCAISGTNDCGNGKICSNHQCISNPATVTSKCTNGACYNYQLCSGGKLTSTPGSCGLPKDLECTSNTGACESLENGTSRKCVGSVYAYYDTSICVNKSVSTSSSSVTDKCLITASYTTVGEHELDHCKMSCVDGKAITVSGDKCKSILPTVSQTSQYSAASIIVLASELDLSALNVSRIKKLMAESNDLQRVVDDKILNLGRASEYQPSDVCYSSNGSTVWSDFVKYCEALGKNPTKNCSATGEKYSCNDSASIKLEPSKVYAAETASDAYTFFLPEYGMYSFELGENTISTQVSDGKTIYLFYIEANGTTGFQMPADPDNPTSDEDIVLSSSASQITYKKESTAQQYTIKKGINIISFNFVPVSKDSGAYTAKDVISQASTNGVEVQYISTFDGGRWNSGYSCSSGTCTGNNFTIVPGKGYLVYATQNGTVTIPGYNLTSSVPVAFSAGWNLVGVHGYTTAYTARSFIDSVNTIEGLTANNVSWWPTSKSKYEGLQVDGNMEYGLDFSMSPNNGYFVRISKFAPTDTKCKSLIWNAGGNLNGTCGNTK